MIHGFQRHLQGGHRGAFGIVHIEHAMHAGHGFQAVGQGLEGGHGTRGILQRHAEGTAGLPGGLGIELVVLPEQGAVGETTGR